MQDVAQRGYVVALAEVCCLEISSDEGEAVREAETTGRVLGDRQHACPVHGRYRHAWGALRECDAPYAGTCSKIEHAYLLPCVAQCQMLREHLRRRVAHGEDIHDELLKEVAAFALLIYRARWFACRDDIVQLQPLWN